MSYEIAIATQCRHCPRKFYGPRGPTIIGEKPGNRYAHFVAQLGKHIVDNHPEIAEQMLALNWEFQGYNLMRHYDTSDPDVLRQEDIFRWRLHQNTLKCRAQKLEERAHQVATEVMTCLDPSDDPSQIEQRDALQTIIRRQTLIALEELRMLLEEPNLYVPVQTEKAGPVPVPD